MKFILAAVCSLGLLFSWAACVALGVFKIGVGIEPAVFTLSVASLFVLVLCGVLSELWFHHQFNKQVRH